MLINRIWFGLEKVHALERDVAMLKGVEYIEDPEPEYPDDDEDWDEEDDESDN